MDGHKDSATAGVGGLAGTIEAKEIKPKERAEPISHSERP
jgi:hypothetical protein